MFLEAHTNGAGCGFGRRDTSSSNDHSLRTDDAGSTQVVTPFGPISRFPLLLWTPSSETQWSPEESDLVFGNSVFCSTCAIDGVRRCVDRSTLVRQFYKKALTKGLTRCSHYLAACLLFVLARFLPPVRRKAGSVWRGLHLRMETAQLHPVWWIQDRYEIDHQWQCAYQQISFTFMETALAEPTNAEQRHMDVPLVCFLFQKLKDETILQTNKYIEK